MSPLHFAIPGDLQTRTGGYAYDRALLTHLSGVGVDIAHLPLPDGFPFADGAAIDETLRILQALPVGDICVVDGLAFGVLPADGLSRCQATLVALVHHPLCRETGLSSEIAARLRDSERSALAHAAHVIVTSQTTRETLISDFGVPGCDITVAVPGVTRRSRANGSRSDECSILAVGSVVPRKGYEVLVEALSRMSQLPWQLTIAGSLTRAPETADRVRKLISLHGLGARIQLAGEIDDDHLADLYESSDLFVLASLYEGYGMVLAEAMVCGLPIVTTTGGASGDTVPDEAALKVPSGDHDGLRHALSRAISDCGLRSRLADASWRAGQHLPDWTATSQQVAAALRRLREQHA